MRPVLLSGLRKSTVGRFLSMNDVIRVYVGSVHSHRLLVEVLAWSIRRHASRPVEIHPIGDLLHGEMPMPRDPKNRPATPFSFQRFAVPMLAGYQGRAIYMDSDKVVLSDIARLFDAPMYGMRLLCRRKGGPDYDNSRVRSSMMLLNCGRLDWSPGKIAQDLDEGRYSYGDLMSLKSIRLKGSCSRHWNSLDLYEPGHTCLLHFTRKETQPWLCRYHPHPEPWFEALFSGLDAGAVSAESIEYSLKGGFVRPSLQWQVEQRVASPAAVPERFHAADEEFYEFCRRNKFNNLDGDYR